MTIHPSLPPTLARLAVCAAALAVGALAAEVRAFVLLEPFDVELDDIDDGLPSTLPARAA